MGHCDIQTSRLLKNETVILTLEISELHKAPLCSPNYHCKCKKKYSNPLCQVPESTRRCHKIGCSTQKGSTDSWVFTKYANMPQILHGLNTFFRVAVTTHISVYDNIDHATWSAFLTSVLDHLHVGLFRPIRLQHKWMMTTSFTCSTGLGDKLMPLLLPGMFWLLFVRLQRELCVTDDDEWH